MNLYDLRTQKGISQSELAKQIGVSSVYVCLLENGKRKNPSMDVILRLADSLGVSVEQLLRGKKAG